MSRGILSFKICAVNHLSVEANSRLLHLFARLIETQTENKYEPAETKDYALTAKSFMDDHFSEPIKIQDVADALHIHPNYLSQIFRKTYKQSPKAYLSSLRIHKAALLLDLTDYSISAISNFVGFNSQHHFAKAFRNTFGCSPTDYRNRKIKGGPFYEIYT